jgi:hypothetical protein
MDKIRLFLPPAICVLLLTGSGVSAADIDFSHQIVPILRQHCVECHGGTQAKGGFSINTRRSFLDDELAVPGNAAESYFLDLVTSDDADSQMPPKEKPRVPEKHLTLLRDWVNAGMPWQEGFTFAPQTYEPPLKPRRPDLPPAVDDRTNPVDRIIDAYLAERLGPTGERPEPLGDAAFLRRVHLDLVGLLPEPETLDQFLADPDPDKRTKTIRSLLADDVRYAEHWLTFWNDLLRNDYGGTGFITGGRKQVSKWLYNALATNMPFDQFARELIAPPTAESRGYIDGIKWRGNVSAGQTVEIQFAQSVSQTFLGINMKCASCHDSFIDRWKLSEAYGLAAIYANRTLDIHRCDKPTGETARAGWLFPELGQIDPQAPPSKRLAQLAALMTHAENGRFTRTIVNRLWCQLMGRGIVHPLDAMQTEPWNADLLDYLAVHLSDNGYDLKKTLELIATSRAYQSQAQVVPTGVDDRGYVYAGPRAKRMTAEQFVDAVWQITGAAPRKFDAPVVRGSANPGETEQVRLSAEWIWGDSASSGVPPAGETIALRQTVQIDRPIQAAGAVVTCDNEYRLYVNGREVAKDTDWPTLEAVPLTAHLKTGDNSIVVIAKNAGSGPNAAGLFFQAHLKFADGKEQTVASDKTWRFCADFPSKAAVGKWPLKDMNWRPVTVVDTLDVWAKAAESQGPQLLARAAVGTDFMVRAALLKSDFLMRSLGRPNRDQIVSSRPNELTTLEAIDLSNSETLARALAQGGSRLADRTWPDVDSLLVHVYRSALTRDPTAAELATLRQVLGPEPSAQSIADMLWAVFMTPEFLLIR